MYHTFSHIPTDSDCSLSAPSNLGGSICSGKQLVILTLLLLQLVMAHHPVQLDVSSNWSQAVAVAKGRIMVGSLLGPTEGLASHAAKGGRGDNIQTSSTVRHTELKLEMATTNPTEVPAGCEGF
jgi:hypothetical protein